DLCSAHSSRPGRRHLLRAVGRPQPRARRRAHRDRRKGARRAPARAHPRRRAPQRRAGLPVRAHRAVRHQAVAALPPHPQARRRRPRRRRASAQVGVLLRFHRRSHGADRMAEL
ncbi:MAG: hypothetical protein AVDCRST_MAG65-878, partial [uncultured Solirubrobacteraceae bacterium]